MDDRLIEHKEIANQMIALTEKMGENEKLLVESQEAIKENFEKLFAQQGDIFKTLYEYTNNHCIALKIDLMGDIHKIVSFVTQATTAESEERNKNIESINSLQTEHQTSIKNLMEALNKLQEEMKTEFSTTSFDHSIDVSIDVDKIIKSTVETLTKLIQDLETSIKNKVKVSTSRLSKQLEDLLSKLQSLTLGLDPSYLHESMVVPFLQ